MQLLFFHLISFPLLALQSEKERAQLKLGAFLAKMDTPIVPCNVTGGIFCCHVQMIKCNYLNLFKFFFKVNCGSCNNVTDDGGTIESPHFPEPYDSNLNCLYTINAPHEKKIKLSFTEFKVDKCCDFITVSENASLSANFMLSLECFTCGQFYKSDAFVQVFDELANLIQSSLNGSDTPMAVTSPSNQMTIKFTSNVDNITRLDPSAGPATRWQATYTFM